MVHGGAFFADVRGKYARSNKAELGALVIVGAIALARSANQHAKPARAAAPVAAESLGVLRD
jgi:hypothetical protein